MMEQSKRLESDLSESLSSSRASVNAKADSPAPKMSAAEIVDHYIKVHRDALRTKPEDDLAAVMRPGHTHLENSFGDFAHRLGMKKAFAYLESQLGSVAGRLVLDIGCGRGRWVKEYSNRGAHVTGVDISWEVTNLLARQMPEHRFLCQDLTYLDVPSDSFDIANSVTVLQHLTHDSQRAVLDALARSLKAGGYLVLLENVAHFEPHHMFPHHTEEWIALVEATGLQCRVCWGSNFEILFRFSRPVRFAAPNGGTGGPGSQSAVHSRIKSGIRDLRALVSFPLELMCHCLPISPPTHSVIIFQK